MVQVTRTRWLSCPIWLKPSKIFSYRTNSPMIMKLGMEHYELKLYTVYIIDDSELTLTYFTTMSNLAKLVFVNILGTYIRWSFTGPLVLCFIIYAITSILGSHLPWPPPLAQPDHPDIYFAFSQWLKSLAHIPRSKLPPTPTFLYLFASSQ